MRSLPPSPSPRLPRALRHGRRLALAALALGLLAGAPQPRALAAPARPQAPEGPALETPTGMRLFPALLGEPMPGWLRDFDAGAMRIAYPGRNERRALGPGATLAILRADDLVGAYLLRGGRCVGQVLLEPEQAPAADGWSAASPGDALAARWRREGFTMRPGIVATADRAYGLDAKRFTRRRRGLIERRWLVAWPDPAVPAPPTALGASAPVRWCQGGTAAYPAAYAAALRSVEDEGEIGLAERARRERQR